MVLRSLYVVGSTRYWSGDLARAVWAWLLAPLARGSAADLRIGWQIGWQDAQESRFALASSSTLATGERRFTGRYVPYYTAERILSHGPAAALAVRPSSSVTFDANGSWGLHAAEDAPFAPGDLYQESKLEGERIAPGNFVTLTLTFERGESVTVEVPVVDRRGDYEDIGPETTALD